MIEVLPILRMRPDQLERVTQQALKDNHAILAPTHIVFKDKQVAGCLSVGSIPMVLTWIDTKMNNKFESGKIIKTVENSLRFTGNPFVAFPCSPLSPFHELAEKAGYKKVYEDCSLFIKAL